jgi:hypothetical protein
VYVQQPVLYPESDKNISEIMCKLKFTSRQTNDGTDMYLT